MGSSVFIGDFLHRIKRPMELDAKKYYKLVTIKMNHKGVVLRHEKVGSEIKSKMYKVKTGDFILSGIDARNGAFGIVPKELDGAIVTNDFWYFEIDKDIVDKHLFLELTSTQWFDEICRKGSDGTTQRIRLQKNKFFNQEISLPPIEEQGAFISQFKRNKNNNDGIIAELNHQQTLLKKLRQQILQEAIEGKLTKDWRADNPDVEPASELLKRIQTEKDQRIKEKKIKNQKTLPPISEDEKPFALPDGWSWCRLGNIASRVFDGPFGSNLMTKDYVSVGVRLIRLENIGVLYFKNNKKTFITEEKYNDLRNHSVSGGDIIFSSFISNETRVTVLPEYIDCAINKADCFCIRVDNSQLSRKYLGFYLSAQSTYHQLADDIHGDTRPRINTTQLKKCNVSVPPFPEQKAIVTKVEKLLALCDQLETQLTNNQTHAEQLMQAVLKEAFSQNSGQVAKMVSNA